MRQFDKDKLRKELIEVLSAYLQDPADTQMKKRARMLHNSFGTAGHLVDQPMKDAISMLVGIGWDLPAPPKPHKDNVEKLIFELASKK